MTTEPNPVQNEDVLFHFDDSEDPTRWFDVDSPPYSPSQAGREQPAPSAAEVGPSQATPDGMLQTCLLPTFRLQASPTTHDERRSAQFPAEKGADGVFKAKNPLASQPMLIRRTTSPSQHDLFALSLESAFSLSSRSNSQSNSDSDPNNALPMLSLSPSSVASASSSADAPVQTPADQAGAYTHSPPHPTSQTPDERYTRDLKGKGKERSRGDVDPPPVLPPLGFSPPTTILPPSSDSRPDIGVPGSSKTVASPSLIPERRIHCTGVDDPVEMDDGMEVDITEYRTRFSANPLSPLPRHLLDSPQALQRFIPPLTRPPYIPPHHIPSRRHSFSNGSRPRHLHHSNSDAALTLGRAPAQGAAKDKSKGRLGSVLRSRTPSSLSLGSGIARKLFFRRRAGDGSNSEPTSAGNSRPMTPPPSPATFLVPGIRLPPSTTAPRESNNARSSRVLDLDLPDASAVRMTSCFLPKCGLTIPAEPSPTISLNLNPNPNPNPAPNVANSTSGPSGRVFSPSDSPSTSPIPRIPLEFPYNLATLYAEPVPIPVITARPSEAALLKAKGRSYSSPFPLPLSGPISALDIISTPQLDVFKPLRFDLGSGAEGSEGCGEKEERKKALFDELLPREIKLTIFAWVIWIHERDHERLVNPSVAAKTKSRSVKWTAHKAGTGRNKWVGRDRGTRELIKLGRVSKAWRDLVFDGQLWRQLDLSSFPRLPTPVLTTLAKTAGTFVTSLNLTGHTRLSPETLDSVAEHLCLDPAPSHTLPHTQLTEITFQGCSSVTTRPFHHLLHCSPMLERLNVKGLKAVTNVTLDVLSTSAPLITHLNLSRCLSIDAEGLRSYFAAAMDRGETLRLKDLRVSGLRKVNDDVMEKMGRTCPELEVLDLSYAKDLHNSAVDAFVKWPEDWGVDSPPASPFSPSSSSPTMGYPFPSPSSWPSLASFPSSFLSAFEERERRDRGLDPALKWNHHQESILLTSKEAGRDRGDPTKYRRRITQLRHINFSCCTLLTDIAASHLAHAVPRLEFFEMGGIGGEVREEGLIRLFETTPWIRKIDLEDAGDVGDALIEVLTPGPSSEDAVSSVLSVLEDGPAPQPGHALEDLIISHAIGVNNDALLALVRRCTGLRVLEADGTRISPGTVKEFVKLSRERGMLDARLVAIDCRSVGDGATKEISSLIRPRMGWRAYGARKLGYLDSRDDEYADIAAEVGGGDSGRRNAESVMDECDPERVVVKTFYTWQVVDQVKAAREKRAKTNRAAGKGRDRTSDDLSVGVGGGGGGAGPGWGPGMGGGRSLRFVGPGIPESRLDRQGCVLM